MDHNKDYLFRFLNHILLERNYSQNTYKAYKNDLEDFFGLIKKPIESVDIEDINSYFQKLKEDNHTPSSIARKYSSINSFYKYLIQQSLLSGTPMELFDYPKTSKNLPLYLDYEEIETLLNSITPDTPQGERDKALFELMYSTGIRVSECVQLTIDKINIDENFCIITGKGKKQRIIPFGETCKKFIVKYINNTRLTHNKKNLPYLFLSRNGDKLSRITIWKNLKHYCSLSNISKNIYPHILRHSFATHLISNGADIRFVQELLGHESILTTQIYTHLDYETLVNFYKKYSFR